MRRSQNFARTQKGRKHGKTILLLMRPHTRANLSNGNFEALREALSAINLSSVVGHNNIDDD